MKVKGQCPKVRGTIQLSDTIGIKATEITVYDYTSFIAANGYDTTLFPKSSFLDTALYRDLFTDLRNKTHERFLKKKGKESYTFFFENIKGSKEEKRKLKKWLRLPIEGISFAQANLYCKWIENYYNQFSSRLNRSCYYEIRLTSKEELNVAQQIKGVTNRTIAYDKTFYRFIAIIQTR